MKTSYLTKRYLIFLALLGFISNPLSANQHSKNGNKNPIATIHSDSKGVFWSINPRLRYKRVKVTVSPLPSDGEVIEIVTDLEPSTDLLEDGSYKYELVVTPLLSSSVRGQLRAARKAVDGQEAAASVRDLKRRGLIPRHRQSQTGYFTIANGVLADGLVDLEEE